MEFDVSLKRKEQRRQKRKETGLAMLLLSPYAIIFILFTLLPIVLGFVFSFMQYNPFNGEQNAFVGMQNYFNIFDFSKPITKTFWESFRSMFLFSIVGIPLLMLVSLTLAYFINMHPPGYKLFRAIIYIPSVVSVSIMGIIFGNMFAGNGSGLVNAVFGTNIQWLSGLPFAGDTLRWVVILIASLWWQVGSNFVIFSGALRDVPQSLYEACEVNGGGRWRKILHVTLPNIKPSLTICLFNTIIGYLNLYGQPFVLCDIDNESALVTPMMFIQKYLRGGAVYAKQTGFLCAAAIVFGIIVMAISMTQRSLMSRERRGNKRTREYNAVYRSDV